MIDIGCGLGDFYGFLQNNGFKNINYFGIDILAEMITGAKQKYPGVNFEVRDFLAVDFTRSVDFLVCSGALNMIFGNYQTHEELLKRFISKMFNLCTNGIAFNLLSVKGKHYFVEDSRFYYADQQFWIKYCQQITKKSILLDTYLEHDFTIYMLK